MRKLVIKNVDTFQQILKQAHKIKVKALTYYERALCPTCWADIYLFAVEPNFMNDAQFYEIYPLYSLRLVCMHAA